jgi:hypothetical protein
LTGRIKGDNVKKLILLSRNLLPQFIPDIRQALRHSHPGSKKEYDYQIFHDAKVLADATI